jgi:hypothetical protein
MRVPARGERATLTVARDASLELGITHKSMFPSSTSIIELKIGWNRARETAFLAVEMTGKADANTGRCRS